MIYPDDAKDFSTLMDVTWQSLGRNHVDRSTKQYWFKKLQKYPLGTVAQSFDNWILTSKELPVIDNIIKGCIPKADFYKALPHVADEEIKQDGLDRIKQHITSNTKKRTDWHAWFKNILRNPKNFSDYSVKEARRVAKQFGYDLDELEKK